MGYQKKVSKNQQVEWFKSINNKYNYFFLIIIENTPIGVINCKDVNIKDEYGEGGIFIGNEDYLKSTYPIFASLIVLDFIFNELEIGDKSFIRVLAKNDAAKNYNQQLGYVLIPGQETKKNQWHILTKEKFNSQKLKFKKAAKIYTETDGLLKVQGEVSKNNLDKLNKYLLEKTNRQPI